MVRRDEHTTRARLERLHALTATLAKPALARDAVARIVVDEGCSAIGADRGVVYAVDGDGAQHLLASRGLSPSAVSVVTQMHALGTDGDPDARWREMLPARAVVTLPLSADDRLLGTIVFGFSARDEVAEEDHAFAAIVAQQAAYAFDRANLRERERRYDERVRVLAQAGELLASTLDYDATLENVAAIALPALADFCFVDVTVDGPERRRVVGAHADPTTRALLESARLDVPPALTDATVVCPAVDDAFLQRIAGGPAEVELLRRLRLRSLVSAPMLSAGEHLGTFTVCFGRSGRNHRDVDVTLVEELARRAAVAVKNARLFRTAHEAIHQAETAARHAEEASRLKDEFLANVSHELRTPLSSILGWATLLRSEPDDPTFVGKGLTVIERNARAQQRIIEDILDVSRIITGKLRIDTEPVDLRAVAQDVLDSVRPSAVAKGIELEFVAPEVPCRLAGDAGRMGQILWNLLSNAVKFTPAAGRVRLVLEQWGDRVELRVEDSGRGMDPQFLAHAFERFRQADSSTTRQHGGLGLGLAIVRHLAEMHGGAVSATSEGPGKGSTFAVTLPVRPFSAPVTGPPLTADEEGEAPPTPRAPRSSRLAGISVLVVEDEPDSRELIQVLLASEGAEVCAAASADEALVSLAQFDASVVLSDIGMPGRDGLWLATEIRRRRPEIPMVALTAYTRTEDVRNALDAGFDHHVAKPVDPEQLVRALCETRRAPRPPPARATTAA